MINPTVQDLFLKAVSYLVEECLDFYGRRRCVAYW
jgi:hypothetical protein